MSAPSERRVVVLLWPEPDERALQRRLLIDAAAVAASGSAAMQVVALRGPSHPVSEATPLPAAAHWWDAHHDGLRTPTADALLEMAIDALSRSELGAGERRLLLLPPGPLGIALAARLALALGGISLGRCSALACDGDSVIATRGAYGDRVQLTLRSDRALCVATLRSTMAAPERSADAAPAVRALQLTCSLPAPIATQVIESTDDLPGFEAAKLIVCGGRGMQGEAGFDLLRRVAAQLGGTVGASLPAVDAGWLPVARQIGQSGKFVAPATYLAVGLSGTPQHLAGVADDTLIIAVNKDAAASIFGVAEIGVLGEWQNILPALIKRLDTVAPGRD